MTAAAAPTSPPRRAVLSSPLAFMLLVASVVVLLVIGSSHPSAPSQTSRIAYLDSIIKCPSCDDISIAQSSTQSAGALRTEVATLVHAGRSNAEVESWVTAHVGTNELLVPSGSRLDVLLVLVPVVALVLALACLGAVFWRRRSTATAAAPDADVVLVAAALDELAAADPGRSKT